MDVLYRNIILCLVRASYQMTKDMIGKLRSFLSAGILIILSGLNPAHATDWLQYIASYGDLIQAFGANATA